MNKYRCALNISMERHFIEDPIVLDCEHYACYKCVQTYKENTGVREVHCKNCKQFSNLKKEFVPCESVLKEFQRFSEINFEEMLNFLKDEYDCNLKRFSGLYFVKF